MTSHGRFPSVCFLSSPPGTTRSGRLVSVCSPAALKLFLTLVAGLLTAALLLVPAPAMAVGRVEASAAAP